MTALAALALALVADLLGWAGVEWTPQITAGGKHWGSLGDKLPSLSLTLITYAAMLWRARTLLVQDIRVSCENLYWERVLLTMLVAGSLPNSNVGISNLSRGWWIGAVLILQAILAPLCVWGLSGRFGDHDVSLRQTYGRVGVIRMARLVWPALATFVGIAIGHALLRAIGSPLWLSNGLLAAALVGLGGPALVIAYRRARPHALEVVED